MGLGLTACLPRDYADGVFLGRAQGPDGPHVIVLQGGRIHDITTEASTVSGAVARRVFGDGSDIGAIEDGLPEGWDLLSPIDIQCVKACGVTFAVSAIERVIEERARGDAAAAVEIRKGLEATIGAGIRAVVPGSDEAMALKQALIAQGMWSQYLEVAIGPDAEVFSKSPVLSTVGHGAPIGVRSDSSWNNPEPEVVLVVDPAGEVVGATLGNDVNLRDFEGRSALLLGKAKDNNASCALGPFVRLFDGTFGLDHVRRTTVTLEVTGTDGFRLEGTSPLSEISRDPEELADALMGRTHNYPDGALLLLGTMFAPIQDRHGPGLGFTHADGDRVVVASPELGSLVNRMRPCDACEPWTFGARALMRNLAARGIL